MNIRSFFIVLCIAPLVMLLSGCGVRKKSLLCKLAPGMTKNTVIQKLGRPDEMSCPYIDDRGDLIEVWHYNLATVDKNQQSRLFYATFGTWLLCPPLVFVPRLCMESPYEYDFYFLEFVNNWLSRWGRSADTGLCTHVEGGLRYDYE